MSGTFICLIFFKVVTDNLNLPHFSKKYKLCISKNLFLHKWEWGLQGSTLDRGDFDCWSILREEDSLSFGYLAIHTCAYGKIRTHGFNDLKKGGHGIGRETD